MESNKRNNVEDVLNGLTPETIANGCFPVKELLYNSVYYPASGFDGGVIRDCNVNRKDWKVLSFVYCDYSETEEELHLTAIPRGYRLLGERRLKVEELVPDGWTPELPPNLDMRRYQHTIKCFANQRPFGTWMVFERTPEFDECHGPKRFSLLYICGDGVATYQALYWTYGIAPRAVAIIQPGTGFGGNWSDFFLKSDPLYWTVRNNPAGIPEFVYCGHWSQSATPATANPENMQLHFDWPEYQFMEPAVGYPRHEVILYRHKEGHYNTLNLCIGPRRRIIRKQEYMLREDLESVEMLNVSIIRRSAFWGCHHLERVVFSDQLKTIEESAFGDCYMLRDLSFPDGLEEIGAAAFFKCFQLEHLIIPKSVRRIGQQAFGMCHGLKCVLVPQETLVEEDAFYDCPQVVVEYY